MSNNVYTPRQERILLITSLVVIGLSILIGLRQYATAFLGSGILYVIFRPWFNALVHRRRWNRTAVTAGLLVFALLVIILPFAVLSVLLINRIQYYSQDTEPILKLVSSIEELTGFSLTDQASIKSMTQQGAAFASRQFPSVVGGTLDFIIIIGLLFFALYFMFQQEESFLKGLRRYLPFNDKTLNELGEELRTMVNANVLGQGLISLVQGVLTGVVLGLFGIPDAAFWGTVAFFLSFIPVLGTPLIWGPAGLILISQGETGKGVGLLLVGAIIITNVDNLLRIVLAKRMGDVHPLITLTGIVLGVPIFGILGLVLGPLLIAYFILLFQVFVRQNRQEVKDKPMAN